MLKRVFLLSVLVGFLISANYLGLAGLLEILNFIALIGQRQMSKGPWLRRDLHESLSNQCEEIQDFHESSQAYFPETVTGEESDFDYDEKDSIKEKDSSKDKILHYSGNKPDVAGKLAPGEGAETGEDKQVVGNTVMTMIRRIREIMRRGMFSNSLLRGTMQCIQTWTGCTLDSAMGASGGAGNSFTSATPPNISTCIRQMSDCTRDAANNSPIGTLLSPLPPSTSGR